MHEYTVEFLRLVERSNLYEIDEQRVARCVEGLNLPLEMELDFKCYSMLLMHEIWH